MELRYFILRRILVIIPTIIGLTILVFLILWAIPLDQLLAPYMQLKGLSRSQAILVVEHQLGFYPNDPVLTYLFYLRDLFSGNWGIMFGSASPYNGPVIDAIAIFLPNTIQLAIGAVIVSIAISIPVGTYIGSRPNSLGDQFGRVFSLAGYAMPGFWLAYLLIYLFAKNTGILLPVVPWGGNGLNGYYGSGHLVPWIPIQVNGHPVSDLTSYPTHVLLIDSLLNGNIYWFTKAVEYLILPVLTLTYGILAGLLRFIRAGMVDAINQEYVKTARAKGVPEKTIIKRHVRKNALIPTVTVLGLLVAGLLGGAVAVEVVFGYYGIGYLTVLSAEDLQVWAVMGTTIVFGVVLVIANLVVDVVYAYLDPRIRY
ncbi:MAG: ABC transporter permease [Thermoplasmataceae archaeon]